MCNNPVNKAMKCRKIIHKQVPIFKHLLWRNSLFVLLAPEPGVGVGDLDGQLSCPLHDQFPVLGGHVVGDLSTVSPRETEEKHQVNDNAAFGPYSSQVSCCFVDQFNYEMMALFVCRNNPRMFYSMVKIKIYS